MATDRTPQATDPTPLALVRRREQVGEPDTAEAFLLTSYVFETALKLIALTLFAGLRRKAPDRAHEMAHELIRADGLGTWNQWIRTCITQPTAAFLPSAYQDLVVWGTVTRNKNEDEWFRSAKADVDAIYALLALESPLKSASRPSVRDLLTAFTEIRGKTKAHGALGPDFFAAGAQPYKRAVAHLVDSCPVFRWKWLHLLRRDNHKIRGLLLEAVAPQHLRDADLPKADIQTAGVYLWPSQGTESYPLGELLPVNRECTEFLLPNGGLGSDRAEFIDYASGKTARLPVGRFSVKPVALPASETEGLSALDVQGNVFANLPQMGRTYVGRRQLEDELGRLLRDKNHPIVTLHGRGGIGKTSLALKVAYQLADEVEPVYDQILWFSSRDIDLRPTGPGGVRPEFFDLAGMAARYGVLCGSDRSIDSLAAALHHGDPVSQKGSLFVLDNFESVASARDVHAFFDTHTHLPNKVLITSRERAFKADFPIEVHGMERTEALALMSRLAEDLSIPGLLTEDVEEKLFDYSEGHPYVIRVAMGELAKEGRYVAIRTVVGRRMDILDALFERSFERLSDAGRRVFLTVGSWTSAVSEVALLVVLGERDFDVEAGVEECVRLSLVERRYFSDGQLAYVCPQIARAFARKKLEGDSDRLVIHEDLEILRRFGVLPTGDAVNHPQDEALQRFATYAIGEAADLRGSALDRLERTVTHLAELWPPAWISVAEFRERAGRDRSAVDMALRRAVEENPESVSAWLARATFARGGNDEATYISCRLRAVELVPSDVPLLREVAFEVCKYVNEHVADIPVARRSVYVASLRDLMQRQLERLDATGLSRLAWLYLLEENKAEAWRFASKGLGLEGDNRHCRNIIDRLRSRGFEGP